MDSRVKIDLSSTLTLSDESGASMLSPENIIELCRSAFKNYRDWELIIEREIENGKHLELAWRTETILDWVWLKEDMEEQRRKHAVLWGLAMKQVHTIRLQSRCLANTSQSRLQSLLIWKSVWLNTAKPPCLCETARNYPSLLQ